MSVKAVMQQRRDTAEKWALANPILYPGEIGIETDTRYGKFGDGVTRWNDLPYAKLPIEVLQKSKLNCEANERFTINIPAQNLKFAHLPIEVLKLNSAQTGTTLTVCSFTNGDAEDFIYDDNYVDFNGVMYCKEEYINYLSAPQIFTTGYISFGDVDLTNYGNVSEFITPEYEYEASTLGVALGTSGWEQYLENRIVTRATIYVKNNIAYGINDDGFSILSATWDLLSEEEQLALFQTIRGEPSAAQLLLLGAFKVCCYSTEDSVYSYTVKGTPPTAQLIKPKGLLSLNNYEKINNVLITHAVTGNSQIKIAVTTDNQTFYTYNGSKFIALPDLDVDTILTQGISISAISSISADAWTSLGMTRIGFAYALYLDNVSDDCYTDELSLNLDARGAWKKAVHGIDYDYEYSNNTTIIFTALTAGDYKVNYVVD